MAPPNPKDVDRAGAGPIPRGSPVTTSTGGRETVLEYGRELLLGIGRSLAPERAGAPFLASLLVPAAACIVALIYILGLCAVWFLPETAGKPLPEKV